MEFRRDLQKLGERLGVEVVLGEEDEPIAAAVLRDDYPAILEGCARLMAGCDAFFGMVFERHGTGVVIEQEPVELRASVSFFEAELLEASITQKPATVVQVREFHPSRAMQEFLRLVRSSLGGHIIQLERSEIGDAFIAFCRAVQTEFLKPAWLFDDVSIGRIRRRVGPEAIDPKLSFLGGALREDWPSTINEAILRSAVKRVEIGYAADGRAMGQLEKLSYLWMAVRELAKVRTITRLGEFGTETQRVLELWNSSAAWYGIHGSHPMGCLAALNELSFIRLALGQDVLPWGPRSSAYYSIGTKVRSFRRARRFFRQSLELSSHALRKQSGEPSGLLQMTASARARLARLGEPWQFFHALNDFRKSLELRMADAASPASIGEAQNAYAYALFELPWRRKEALDLAAEGSGLIRTSDGDLGSGFYFRSERKRADMLRRAKRLDEARAVAEDARKLAIDAQAFDQVRSLDSFLGLLGHAAS